VTYGKIDLLTREVDVMHGRGDAKIDAGMRFGEVPEPMHKPLRGEIRRGADGENAGALPL
jgi:hypothetical protein